METVKLKKVGTLPLCLPCRPYYCSTTFPLDKPIPLSILGDWSNQIYPQGYNGMPSSYKTKDSTPQENKTYYIFKNNKYQLATNEDFTNGEFDSEQNYYEKINPKIIKFYYIGEFTGDVGIAESGVKAIKFFATIDGEITNEVTGVVLTSYIKNYYWDGKDKGYIAPIFKYTGKSIFLQGRPQDLQTIETEGIEVNKNAIDLTKIPKSQLPWYEIRFTRRQYSENNSPQGGISYQTFMEDGAAYDGNISKINVGLRYSDTLIDIFYPASYCRKFEPVWKKIPESIFNWNIYSPGDYSLNPQIDLFSCSYNLTIGDFGSQYIGNNEYALTERYQIPTGTTKIKIDFNYSFYSPDLQIAPIEYNKNNSGGLISDEFSWTSFSDSNNFNNTTCRFDTIWYDMKNRTYSDMNNTKKNKKRLLSQRFSILNNLITLELNSSAIQNVFSGAEIAIVCYTEKDQGGLCGFLNMGENSQKSPYLLVEDDTTNSEDINKIWKSTNVRNDGNNNFSIDPINFKLPDYNNKKIQDIQIYLRYHSNMDLDSSDLLTGNNNTLISVKNFIGLIKLNNLSNTIKDFRLQFQASKQTNTSLSLAQILQANIIDIEFYDNNDSYLGELGSSNNLNQLGFPAIKLYGKHQPALNIEKNENDFKDYTFKALKLRQVNESSDFGYILEVFKEDNSSNETKVNIQIGDLFQFKEDSKYLKINNDNDNDIYNINNIYIIQKLFENNKIAAFSYYGGNNKITESSKKIIGLVDINTITLSDSSIEVKPSLDLLATQEDYKQLFCDLLKIKCADYATSFYGSNSAFDDTSDNFYFSFSSSILSNIASVRKWEQTCQTFWNIFYSLLFFFGYDVCSETLTQSEAKENLLANYNFTNLVSAEAEQLSDIILSVLSKTQTFIIDNKRYSFHQNFYQLRISKNKIELAYLEPQDNPQKVETTSNTGIEENQQNISSSNATNTSEN